MRKSPYLPHPAFTTQEHIDEINRHEVQFAIEPRGPSKFRLKSMETNEKWTVSIGTEQTCTCRDTEVCVHIIYIMMRYFGVPSNCDILWQKSLTDHEIDIVLDGRVKRPPPPKPQAIYKTKSGKSKVKRLPIGDEDVCPICYDSLKDCDKSKIAWCRLGCGGNFHRKCVKAWIDSQRCSGKDPLCPLCRERLDMLGINPPRKPPPNAPPPLSESEIRDLMNREITPDDYDLLLKLDQCGHSNCPHGSQQHRQIQPKRKVQNQNQRIQVANRILRDPPDLQITGAVVSHDAPSSGSRAQISNRPIVRRVTAAQNRRPNQNLNPFVAEITGNRLSPELEPSGSFQQLQPLQPLQPSRQPQHQPPPAAPPPSQNTGQRPTSGRLIISGIGSSLGLNNYNSNHANNNNTPSNLPPPNIDTHLRSPAPWHGGGGGENRPNSKRNIVIPPKRPTHFHQAQAGSDSPQFLVSNFTLQ
ncbi:hypothetical protein M9Y10_043365 [Tritrichomonas musculus]|uniref:SWIM zinc finger family protein n=1 Tax=Tritrichomonas musculus TaxID=1915356 RepID=A0ABR2JZH7_9EUKA